MIVTIKKEKNHITLEEISTSGSGDRVKVTVKDAQADESQSVILKREEWKALALSLFH